MKARSLSPVLACAVLLACATFARASSITYTYTSAGPWINIIGGGGDTITWRTPPTSIGTKSACTRSAMPWGEE